MLLIIRQPLGAAALLSLLGSGLMSAELLACAQLTGQVAWATSWSSDEGDDSDLPPGEPALPSTNAGPAASGENTNPPRMGRAASHAVIQLGRMLGCEPVHVTSHSQVLEIAWISHCLPTPLGDAGAQSLTVRYNRTSRSRPEATQLYGLGAEHG